MSSATTADGDLLVLRRRGESFEIRCNGWELMANRAHYSEEEMARLACARLVGPAPSVLIGGLGMGFTLRAALDSLPAAARVTVVEALPAIVGWNRGVLADLAGQPLDDPRVEMVIGDVFDLLTRAPEAFDAVILDVDNGPDTLSLEANERLYGPVGLAAIAAALKPGGGLAVWSADPSPAFEASLAAAGYGWSAAMVAARGRDGDPSHTLYFASPDGDRPT